MKQNNSIILLLISPILGFLDAFQNLKSRQSLITIFLFCLCFGFCFSVGTERYEGSGDGISMRIEFEDNKDISTSQFFDTISEYFEFDTGVQDIYIITISFLVGRFTDNYHFFFLTLAFIFAFFQLQCLKYFVRETNYRYSIICILLTCLFLWNNIFNINGARFWTASWIAIFCVFKIFYDKKWKYILLALCLPMVHASFAVFPIIIGIAYLFKKYKNPLIIVFCISWAFSFFATDFNIPAFNNIELPFAISRKMDFYTDQDYINSLSQGTGFYWVNILFKFLSRNFIELLILLIALNERYIKDMKSLNIVRFTYVLAIIANFGMIVPTFGGRFFTANYALVAYSFLVTIGDTKYKQLIYALPFVWFMNLFYLYKDVSSVLDLGFILSPIFSFIRYIFV